jgi:hypothetical protein
MWSLAVLISLSSAKIKDVIIKPKPHTPILRVTIYIYMYVYTLILSQPSMKTPTDMILWQPRNLGHKEKTEKPNEISGITDGNEKSMFTLYI